MCKTHNNDVVEVYPVVAIFLLKSHLIVRADTVAQIVEQLEDALFGIPMWRSAWLKH